MQLAKDMTSRPCVTAFIGCSKTSYCCWLTSNTCVQSCLYPLRWLTSSTVSAFHSCVTMSQRAFADNGILLAAACSTQEECKSVLPFKYVPWQILSLFKAVSR
jgi:hypothetical protein